MNMPCSIPVLNFDKLSGEMCQFECDWAKWVCQAEESSNTIELIALIKEIHLATMEH